MSPAIHRLALNNHDFVVPCPRATDAIGYALRRVYRAPDVPRDMASTLATLDAIGRA